MVASNDRVSTAIELRQRDEKIAFGVACVLGLGVGVGAGFAMLGTTALTAVAATTILAAVGVGIAAAFGAMCVLFLISDKIAQAIEKTQPEFKGFDFSKYN